MLIFPAPIREGRARQAEHRYQAAERSFTLLEMLVVVTVLAVVAGVAVVRFGAAGSRAAFGQAIARWEQTDYMMRNHARRHDRPVRLEVDLSRNRLVQMLHPQTSTAEKVRSLGSRVRIERFMSPTRSVSTGTVAIAYTPLGASTSYAVELAGPDGGRVWLLVAGLTGQMTRFDDAKEVEHVMQSFLQDSIYAR